MAAGRSVHISILINAKSGVAVIFGLKTKQLLFLGVRNKYCSATCVSPSSTIEF